MDTEKMLKDIWNRKISESIQSSQDSALFKEANQVTVLLKIFIKTYKRRIYTHNFLYTYVFKCIGSQNT